MTAHIDKMMTEASLRSVKCFDIDAYMLKKWDDLNDLQGILRRNGIKNNVAAQELEKEYKDLQKQMEDWRKEIGINASSIRQYRTVILIEEIKNP